MTEIVTCARCHCKFERVCVENEAGQMEAVFRPLDHGHVEHEPVCEECEHEFLAWTACAPIV